MDYQIVHAIEGRLRLRVPLLATDAGFAEKLQQLIGTIASVTSVRINSSAQSIIITYKHKKLSQSVLLQAVETAIAQAAPSPEPDDIQSAAKSVANHPVEIPLETVSPIQAAVAQPAAADSPIVSDSLSDTLPGTLPEASVTEPTNAEPTNAEQTNVEQTETAASLSPAAIDFDAASVNLEEDPWAESPSVVDAAQSGAKKLKGDRRSKSSKRRSRAS